MSTDSERAPAIPAPPPLPTLSIRRALGWALVAAACFHIAHLVPHAGYAILGFFVGLLNLARVNNARHGFRWGIVLGWALYVPHLGFFWPVFVSGSNTLAIKTAEVVGVFALWMVLPIWLGLFLCLATWLRRWTKPAVWILLIPVGWTGIEYFRGELYPLKFSWLSAGYAFASSPWMVPFPVLGMYGVGFVLMLLAATTLWAVSRSKPAASVFVAIGVGALILLGTVMSIHAQRGNMPLEVAFGGVQLEFPANRDVIEHLDGLIEQNPEIELVVLSEYTFSGPIPESILNWCRDNGRYLIAGGKDPLGRTNFYNTAFVVGPDGEIVFKQIKAVPIQFFADGLPAPEQRVWDSPWGKLGLCICYDLGYTRVTDELVRQGAVAIIAPTMDVMDWGGYQHWLHARVAPVRAAEYNISIFRLTSSGISQYVLPSGKVAASRPYPGQGEILVTELRPSGNARLPSDRRFAPFCVIVTIFTALFAAIRSVQHWIASRRERESL